MVPLCLCSVGAVTIIIHKAFWGLKRGRLIPKDLVANFFALIEQGKFSEIRKLAYSSSSAITPLVICAIDNADKPRELLVEKLETVGRIQAQRLNRMLSSLGIIASISPLLGLLGTVFGMIKTFQVIGNFGIGNPQQLAAGIAEALITTAAGLIIGIPALVAYRAFISRSNTLILEMEHISLELVEATSSNLNKEQTKARQSNL
ncbi:MAG: MotA/TolQ/ExbB proton channel family protein [Deltaproteobacteria bacterium]|nr:MotA/TolQ/ExbB proton channel family protein [Deltaproteobacteria bacterium]